MQVPLHMNHEQNTNPLNVPLMKYHEPSIPKTSVVRRERLVVG